MSNTEHASASSHDQSIREAAGRLESGSIAFLQRLVVAGKDGQAVIDALVAQRLRDLGCSVEDIVYDPRDVPMVDEFATQAVAVAGTAKCIVGRTGRNETSDLDGAKNGRSLILFAHPDTEAYRPLPKWRSDPFVPVVRDGRLFGWGVADDLAGVAVLLEGLAVLKDARIQPAGDLILISSPSKKHARGISAALHYGLDAAAAVYLHPAESGRGLAEIKAFAPGQLEFRITVEGRAPETNEPAHTAFAHLGVNPFVHATRIVQALEAYDADRGMRIMHPLLQNAIGRSTNLMLTHCAYGDISVPTRIAPDCTIGGAISLVPGEKLDAVMAEIEAVAAAATAGDEWLSARPPRVDWIAGVSAAETSSEADIYGCVSAAIINVGTVPEVNPLHTSSDIRNPIIQKQIPTVGYGPLCGGLSTAGLSDEWIDVADYLRTIRVTASVITAWCGAR
jgi:acetylornithine deacetylase